MTFTLAVRKVLQHKDLDLVSKIANHVSLCVLIGIGLTFHIDTLSNTLDIQTLTSSLHNLSVKFNANNTHVSFSSHYKVRMFIASLLC